MSNDLTAPVPKRRLSDASRPCSQPLNVSTATAVEIRDALNADPLSAREIAQRLAALRAAGVGYWEDLTEAEAEAALMVWREALSAVPGPFAAEAFGYWARTGTRRPYPGDIGNRARLMAQDAAKRLAETPVARPAPFVADEPDPEELERRRRFAASIADEFPVLRRMPKPKPQDYERTIVDKRIPK